MRPTEELTAEHQAIKRMIGVAERASDKLDRGDPVPANHLAEIVDFIQGFADKCHHAKEEVLLFPAMEKAGIPRDRGPIGVMLHEHKEGRDFVRGMKAAAEKYAAGDGKAAAEFSRNARGYAALLRQHIDKEDNILFRMADARFSENVQLSLEKEFERVEREVAGDGEHERYHNILRALESLY